MTNLATFYAGVDAAFRARTGVAFKNARNRVPGLIRRRRDLGQGALAGGEELEDLLDRWIVIHDKRQETLGRYAATERRRARTTRRENDLLQSELGLTLS